MFNCRISAINKFFNQLEVIGFNAVSQGENPVNEKERLFAQFFNNEKISIDSMSLLELRAHREQLATIAFEARARLTAVDERDRELTSERKRKSNTGFNRSVEIDDLSSNAINQINERKKKLSKSEKAIESMKKLGIDASTAEHLASAGNILSNLRKTGSISPSEPAHKIVNPFEKITEAELQKKYEPETVVTDVSINEDTNTIIIKEETTPVEQIKPKFTVKNPFAK